MARVVSFLKVIRNNWKKSILGAAAFSYGVSYSIDAYETDQIMRQYCQEAVTYGDQIILPHEKPEQLVVILNPVANKRKAKKLFEKYCEPLLHLAGFAVTIIQTQSENQARNLVANLNTKTDIIVVAGGDGTLSDVVTGIMRKCKNNSSAAKQCPIGILPLGQTNRVADSLFHGYDDLVQVRKLVDATMAIVRKETKLADVVQVELLERDPDVPVEPVYAVGAVEWGAWKDAQARMDKYWYFGALRRYVTYIFSGYKKDINWKCDSIVRYSDPCIGCSKCYSENYDTTDKRWWHVFIPKAKNYSAANSQIDYSKRINENCGVLREIPVSTTELNIITQNVIPIKDTNVPSIKIELGPESINYTGFVKEGWQRLKGAKTLIEQIVQAKEIEIHPVKNENFADRESQFYIDNEEFELKPVKFKLLPNTIRIFCPKNQSEK